MVRHSFTLFVLLFTGLSRSVTSDFIKFDLNEDSNGTTAEEPIDDMYYTSWEPYTDAYQYFLNPFVLLFFPNFEPVPQTQLDLSYIRKVDSDEQSSAQVLGYPFLAWKFMCETMDSSDFEEAVRSTNEAATECLKEYEEIWKSIAAGVDCIVDNSKEFFASLKRGVIKATGKVLMNQMLNFFVDNHGVMLSHEDLHKVWGSEHSWGPCLLDFLELAQNNQHEMGKDKKISTRYKELFEVTTQGTDFTYNDLFHLWSYYLEWYLFGLPEELTYVDEVNIGRCNFNTAADPTIGRDGAVTQASLLFFFYIDDPCICKMAAKTYKENSLEELVLTSIADKADEIINLIDKVSSPLVNLLTALFQDKQLAEYVCPAAEHRNQMLPVEWFFECPETFDLEAVQKFVFDLLFDGLESNCGSAVEQSVCGDGLPSEIHLFPALEKLNLSKQHELALQKVLSKIILLPRELGGAMKQACDGPKVDNSAIDPVKVVIENVGNLFFVTIGLGALCLVLLFACIIQRCVSVRRSGKVVRPAV